MQADAGAIVARWWQIGRFRFDTVTRRLEDEAGGVSLPVKMAAVLQRLAERRGDVVLRDELVREVWEGNVYTGTRALTQVIWKLRRLLDGDAEPADGVGAIRTVSKTGYQLVLPVEMLPPPEVASPAGMPPAQAPDRGPVPYLARLPAAAWVLLSLALLVLVGIASQRWIASVGMARTGVDAEPLQAMTMLDGVEDYPAYNADGSRLAFVWQRAGEAERVRIVNPRRPDLPPRDLHDDPGYTLARPMWLGPGELAYARARDGTDCEVVAVQLETLQRRRLARCFFQRRLAFVDASPDGRWLALARHQQDGQPGISIVLHSVADGSERVLTRPNGLDDGQISFSRSGRQVAFVRGSVTVGDVYVVDIESGRETRLTHDQAPLGGLSWLSDDSGIVFSSVRDGTFANWHISAQGGAPTLFSRTEAATNLAPIPGDPLAVAAVVHKFADTIQRLPLIEGPPLSTLSSNGRNLYAQPCPGDDQLIFMSTRGGRVALWASDGRGERARALPLPPGTPDTASCSPREPRWATTLRPPGADSDSFIIGRLDNREPPLVLAQSSTLNNVIWSLDGRSLIVSSDRNGSWDLWRFDLASRRFDQLTDDHASFGREVQTPTGRWLYYARTGQRGLWRRALADGHPPGPPQPVTDRLDPEDWGNWQWYDGALWLLQRGSAADHLLRCDEAGRNVQIVRSFAPRQVRQFRSLAIAAGDVLITSNVATPQADIVRLAGPH